MALAKHPGSGFTMPALVVTFPLQVEEGPQNSGRLQRSLCAYLPVNGPRWAPRGVGASQKLQWLFTDTWDWLLYELLNWNQRNFFCTYFCNKQNCPIEWVNDSINHWKSPPMEKKHARIKETTKPPKTHCVQTDLLGHSYFLFFWKQIWKKGLKHKSKYRRASMACCFIWQLAR